MKNFREHAYNLFIVFIILFLIASLFSGTKELDIQLSDTYVVFPAYLLLGILIIFFLLCYLLYRLAQKYLWSRYLTWTHIFLTTSILSIFATEVIFFGFMGASSYEPYSGFKKYHEQLLMIKTVTIIFLAAQFLFLVNLGLGLLIKKDDATVKMASNKKGGK